MRCAARSGVQSLAAIGDKSPVQDSVAAIASTGGTAREVALSTTTRTTACPERSRRVLRIRPPPPPAAARKEKVSDTFEPKLPKVSDTFSVTRLPRSRPTHATACAEDPIIPVRE